MCQDENRQLVFLLEIVELDHQPSCCISLFHGTAQIGKVVNDEYPASRLHCHLLDATDDCLLEVGIKEGITIKRYTVQPFRERIEIAVLVGIAELELFLGQLEIQVQHIVGLCYTVSYLYGKDGLAHIGVGKEAGQFPLIPEAIP